MNYNYSELLKRAKNGLPELKKESSRFELPKAVVETTGRQTVIRNLSDISGTLRREAKHLVKFLLKELAIPGNLKDSELILQGKIDENMVNKKLEDYTKEFVLCKECGKADTVIETREKMKFIKCEACGASRPLRAI
jgi:translation initiation factor 2 subunit 2